MPMTKQGKYLHYVENHYLDDLGVDYMNILNPNGKQ